MENTTQTEEIKNEIAASLGNRACCNLSMISALIRTRGVIHLSQQKSIVLRCSDTVIDFVEKMAELYGLDCQFTLAKKALQCSLMGDILPLLIDSGIVVESVSQQLSLREGINEFLIVEDCCKQAYLQGVFLSCGAYSKNGRFISFWFHGQKMCEDVARLLECYGLNAKQAKRVEGREEPVYVLSLYGMQNMVDLLLHLQATNFALHLQEDVIRNEVIALSHRATNCDLANTNKNVLYCESTVLACNAVLQSDLFADLDETLKNTMQYRIDNPNDTLSQLAQIIGVSKSCVKHRLQRIINLAKTKS
ncbi:MAG: DNA-binding protein WhiA [Firmicutes bacterium]|nr:DNA-binding protein WhiA [Bacillota bacterium]